MNLSQDRVQAEAAVRVHSMVQQNLRDAGANLDQLMQSAQIITDPSRGNFVDMLA